nr:hypothetical protein CFP56_76312 [Quercus suber]
MTMQWRLKVRHHVSLVFGFLERRNSRKVVNWEPHEYHSKLGVKSLTTEPTVKHAVTPGIRGLAIPSREGHRISEPTSSQMPAVAVAVLRGMVTPTISALRHFHHPTSAGNVPRSWATACFSIF